MASVLDQAEEVLVVDNGSPGSEASRVAERLGARAVRVRKNGGFARGVNAGVGASRGDVIAMLNDDAVASEGWLRAAAEQLEDATVAAVAPKLLLAGRYLEIRLDDDPWQAPGDDRQLGRKISVASLGGSDVLSGFVGPGIHRLEGAPAERQEREQDPVLSQRGRAGAERPHGRADASRRWRWTSGRAPFYVPVPPGEDDLELHLDGELVRPTRIVDLVNSVGSYLRRDGYVGDIGADMADDERFDSAEERFSLSGAAFVTRREMMERVGPFEGRYFAYYEDVDWCWRARLMGLRLIYDPAVRVRHERGATSGGMASSRVRFLAERNRLVTLFRNAPLEVAIGEAWRKRRGRGDDGVAEVIGRTAPRALGERAVMRRRWVLSSAEVFERWAGVEVPSSRS